MAFFYGEFYLQQSDTAYFHPCEPIMKFWRNNRIHLHKTEIETSENNLLVEYMLNKISVHVFVSSFTKFKGSVLNQLFSCCRATSYDTSVTQR